MEVHEALKRFRQSTGLNQEEIAKKLGIKRQAYQPYETGKVTPSVGMIIKIADVFHVTTDYLLGRSDEPRPKPVDKILVATMTMWRDSIQQVLERVDSEEKKYGNLQNHESTQWQAIHRADEATA